MKIVWLSASQCESNSRAHWGAVLSISQRTSNTLCVMHTLEIADPQEMGRQIGTLTRTQSPSLPPIMWFILVFTLLTGVLCATIAGTFAAGANTTMFHFALMSMLCEISAVTLFLTCTTNAYISSILSPLGKETSLGSRVTCSVLFSLKNESL